MLPEDVIMFKGHVYWRLKLSCGSTCYMFATSVDELFSKYRSEKYSFLNESADILSFEAADFDSIESVKLLTEQMETLHDELVSQARLEEMEGS